MNSSSGILPKKAVPEMTLSQLWELSRVSEIDMPKNCYNIASKYYCQYFNQGTICKRQERNASISSLIRHLGKKDKRQQAKKEIKERFNYLSYYDQNRILRFLFTKGRVNSRLALSLMLPVHLQSGIFDNDVLEEYINDGAISNAAKNNAELFLLKYASQNIISVFSDRLLLRCRSHYILASIGLENMDASLLSPKEYILCFIKRSKQPQREEFMGYYTAYIEHYIKNGHYKQIHRKLTWIPSLISLSPTQNVISQCAQYNKNECIDWIVSLDRAIQTDFESTQYWNAIKSNTINEENISKAMDFFYGFAVQYIDNRHIALDLTLFKNEDNEDAALPF